LVESEDRDDLAEKLRSAISVCRGTTNVTDVARTVYWWGDPQRRRLATEYYGGTE
jgi:CRISPR type I-E-associated protein CasB/Cse2